MKAIIIDDEKQAITSLKMELENILPKIELIGVADSVKSGITLLEKTIPDILFLDIRLNDGLGFEILENIDSLGKFEIVFTTAYDQYAISAFKKGAFDYLLKPIDLADLQQTIDRIHKRNHIRNEKVEAEKLSLLSTSIIGESRISLSTTEGIYLKRVEDIIRIQAEGNYTKFFFKDSKKSQLISKTLKDYELILGKLGFLRIHFSHLINVRHLERYSPKDGGHVIMSNQDIVPVSTRKKSVLLEALKKFTVSPE